MKNKIFTRGVRVRTPDVHNSFFELLAAGEYIFRPAQLQHLFMRMLLAFLSTKVIKKQFDSVFSIHSCLFYTGISQLLRSPRHRSTDETDRAQRHSQYCQGMSVLVGEFRSA